MIDIRSFQPQDQEPVIALIQQIMDEEFSEDQKAYPIEDLRDIACAYGRKGEAFFVAVIGGKVVGTAAVKREDDRAALLRRLFVARAYRKQKVGKKLIEKALGFCKKNSYQEVVFKATSRMEAATQICQKSGFVPRAKIRLGALELLKLTLLLPHVKMRA